jgi:hypothetical protein
MDPDPDIDDDTHICLKCRTTIAGTYIILSVCRNSVVTPINCIVISSKIVVILESENYLIFRSLELDFILNNLKPNPRPQILFP